MRRLLVIDSLVSPASPTMKSWLLAAADALPSRFDEVEVWGFRCDLQAPWLKFRHFRPVTNRWAIQWIFYERAVRKMAASLPKSYWDETLVQCTGMHLDRADIRYIQFWHKAYTEAAAARPRFLKLPLKDRILTPWISKREEVALTPGNTGEWWCVSRGIAAPIIRDSRIPPEIRYLPNSYDPARFNPATRNLHRTAMRQHHGFGDNEIVLAFSAYGHFERKGLRQAVQATALLREKGHPVRLLVLGGSAGTIKEFRKAMAAGGVSVDGCVFAGLTDAIERHLSAADAYFMPSHFEAFSLAEIEAAALGLRLYLTAHPGHEMILREHVNGRLLPWEPEGMAAILAEEIERDVITRPHTEMGEAVDPIQYASLMGGLYDAAIHSKWRAPEIP